MLKNIFIGVALLVVLIIGAIFPIQKEAPATNNQLGGAVITNTQTHANDLYVISSATSTLKVESLNTVKGGCIEMNATSSATKVFLRFGTVATSSFNGLVGWNYGTCK